MSFSTMRREYAFATNAATTTTTLRMSTAISSQVTKSHFVSGHALFADGYILAQAPFDDDTELDFWRMTAQQKPQLIVVLSALTAKDGRKLIKNFWPAVKQDRMFGMNKVRSTSVDENRDHDMYELSVLGANKQVRRLQLLHFHKWVDDEEIPDNLLDLRANVRWCCAMLRQIILNV